MNRTITVSTIVLILPILAVVAALWFWLTTWLWGVIEPRFFRWYWHHLGGEGEPPSKLERNYEHD